MQYARTAPFALFLIGSLLARQVCADDALGLYVGGALGQSDVRVDQTVFSGGALQSLDLHRDAWKLMAGFRPISLIGAELDYMDFGRARHTQPPIGAAGGLTVDSRPRATVLFGVIYAPLPVPLLDVYAKAGIARLQTEINVNPGPPCSVFPCVVTVLAPLMVNRTDQRFAYGVGVQVRFAAFAARFEYERINANTGDPDLASLGLTWNF